MQGRQAARLGLALLLGVIGPALAAGAELRAGAGARIVQAAGLALAQEPAVALSPEGRAEGGFTLSGAPNTAVSLSIEAVTGAATAAALGDLSHDAGPTPATDASGALTVRLGGTMAGEPAGLPVSYSIIVHY